ncbi:M15 family metallopeptidase [Gilvimarinus sp. SDUM040013]|uniref:M15 family metallopeptidase n=1 Tax=Gilvimarinus gilvus TaxID=3058038 RepID=A0ABU4RZQ6_9GAMM|nr:M15 family metallopeptidase [Gilvimarinus sp. SDUM040013]MDO3386111.1 M15 family metallopeptidase [Gilvimarinus sp. SDUM040013]MDX6850348.1 M15 family metallopeptidase [Gilvimarinus sp. SDUM040013]
MCYSLIERQALGLDDTHLVEFCATAKVHRDLVQPLSDLYEGLRPFGCKLAVASGFRSFERQLAIFNAKASGERAILDDLGNVIDIRLLSKRETLWAILRFSALPGASRHHWGTDIDVYDKAAVSEGYRLQLVASEYDCHGVFRVLGRALPACLENCGFYRPYTQDKNGVAPEPWHLSCSELAEPFAKALTKELLSEQLAQTDILLKSEILNNIDEIYRRFVAVGAS